MSTWISRACAPLLFAGLAGCGAVDLVTRSAPERVAVAGDSIWVAGPPGYCIDRSASNDGAGGAFVLLGSCASLSRDASRPHPQEPGVLTVTVSEGGIAAGGLGDLLGDLEAYFQTPEGRASLSRDGRAGSVELLTTRIADGALYLHARDAGGRARGMADDYWRALFDINGRLVTLSVNAFSATPLSVSAGFATLEAFAARIRAANAEASG